MMQFRFAQENTLRTPDDYGFNALYLIACAAHRIDPARWHDSDVKRDPKIQGYMQWLKPRLSVTIDEKDFASAKLKDPRTWQTRIVVVAGGNDYSLKSFHPKGGWYAEEFRNTDEELVKKFVNNSARVMPSDKAYEAANTILMLEKTDDITKLMEMLVP